ncbi:putative reverse transcriptase domain-containing protein [Tanacetum coccineum]|uniref:Reverse transcriptase domain-containing protein n=1 Tax=Tanacetum coccineum TaxID=301880 RepID=A0ABQ5J8S5_9ASTR
MSSDLASSEVTYTSISSHGDPLAWALDFFGLQEPDSSEAAPASPYYVHGPEEPKQALLSLDYVPRPEYLEYLAPSDLSPGYVANSNLEEDLEEDSEDGPVDYPADGGNGNDDDSSDNDEEEEASEEEEEEHLALADSVVAPVVDHVPSSEETKPFETDESAATPPSPPAYHTTARISIRLEAPMPFPSEEEVERLLALPPPPPSPLISLSPPSAEEHLARCLAAPTLPSSPLPIVSHPYGSPNHMRAPLGFRAAMGRLRASSPSTHHPLHPSSPLPPPPSSLHLPPYVPTSLPLPSSPLPPLPASLFIPPPVDHLEDIPEAELPPHKRLCLTALTSRYEVGESSTAAPRPTGGHGIDYGFIGTLDTETRRQRTEEVGYGIRDVWADSTKAVEEVAPTTLEGVNAKVTELAVVQEQDTQDLIKAIVSAALANNETLRNSTNGQGDGSHNSNTRIRGTWNSHMKTVTQDVAYAMEWKALKKMMTVKYCPRGEIKKMFHEESEEVEKYVGGLPDMIRGNVMSYQPKTMEKAIEFANDQMNQKVLTTTERQAKQKRKLEFNAGNNQGHQQQNKRQNTGRVYTARPVEKREYTGSLPLCKKCNYHHKGPCAPRCNKCKKIGHLARDCRSSGPNGNNNNRGNSETTQNAGTYHECGVQGHFKRDCLKLKNKNHGNQGGNGNALAKVYVVGNAGINPDSNAVTGTFLLNNRYASILFDIGADRSFVSTTFSSLIDITPTTLDHYYDVELADGKIIRINTIIWGCTLNFLDHPFNINLMPIELGSFDVIVGMDWLVKYHAIIDCTEKIVRIPWGNETLIVHGDGSNQGNGTRLNIISCTKTHKYLLKGNHVFLAHVTMKETKDKSGEKRLEDVPIV